MYGDPELETVSEGWRKLYDLSSTMIPNVSSAVEDDEHICKLILYKEIKDSRVRIWDVIILIPNLLFLLFIVARFNRARLKLRATSSPIFLAFYGLVICNVVISVIRCVVSMTVNAAATVGGKADKILWVTVRFCFLSTEMSVVIFGLAFGHLDSRSSIRRVLFVTALIALAFTITQGTLELILPDDTFRIPSRDFYVFGHGGMMFWFCSSIVFTIIYLFILILPWTRLRERLTLPTRKIFYVYAGTLATLDLVQSIGAGLLNYTRNPIGLCIVDFTAGVYLTFFTPLVYHTFLSEFFGISQPSILFSYKAQVDDAMDEDTVSLPHQQSFSSLKTDSDYIYQVHTPYIHMPLYDSQASKSSASKQRSSMHSLASAKGSKNSSTDAYESRVTLYKSRSAVKTFSRRHSNEKSSPELADYPLTKSESLAVSQKSSPDLRFSKPTWSSGSMSNTKYAEPDSVSNLILSSATASNLIYNPKTNDSSVNLYSEMRQSSTESAITTHPANESSRVPRFYTASSEESVIPESSPKRHLRETSQTSPLENTLHSILYPRPHKATSNEEELLVQSTPSTETIVSTEYSDLERPKTSSKGTQSMQLDSHDILSKLLPQSATFAVESSPKKQTNDPNRKESAGLNDYLLSLSSSKPKPKERENPGRSTKDPDSSYMQTEYL